MNVTVKKLESNFKGEGLSRFKQIAELGGFGTVSAPGAEGGIDPNSEGGLDLSGVLDPENSAITDAKKNKIRELAGELETEPASSADKMKGKEK